MSIQLKNVKKTYGTTVKTKALDDVNLTIELGKFVVVLGPSGSGKSTLLNVLGGLDTVDAGRITIDDTTITSLKDKDLTQFRRENFGFVFQQYNLLQTLTLKENVELGARLVKDSLDVDDLINDVGLKKHTDKFPSQLSGGEQQRVSIARALAKNPKILFC